VLIAMSLGIYSFTLVFLKSGMPEHTPW